MAVRKAAPKAAAQTPPDSVKVVARKAQAKSVAAPGAIGVAKVKRGKPDGASLH
ncbi:hypothetical protein [Neomegalonema perideroedes]|uniref:hypothetical protein n=1 Tax=Neomegalonema perideroedes TaxID=217219 RepID=UPI000368A9D6|nr:hypothetical protein [Neomegalonema perideroedes]